MNLPQASREGRQTLLTWVVAVVLSALIGAGAALSVDSWTEREAAAVANGPPPAASPSGAQGTPVAGAGIRDVADLYAQIRPSVLKVSAVSAEGSGVGSGVVLDKEGHILTNAHVVAGASQLEVKLADGTVAPAKLMGTDVGDDLAVLMAEVPPEKLTPIKFGSSDQVRVGQAVIAIGNPFELEATLTEGVVSGIGRVLSGGETRPLRQLIQTDTAINPGNSGGGLFNLRGELIGITNALENPSGQAVFVGIGYAIPVSTVQRFLPDMLAGRNVIHPKLGIALLDVTPAIAKELGLTVQRGVLVQQVEPGSGAARAGLRGAVGTNIGDVITAIDGREAAEFSSIADYLDTKKAGDRVELRIVRGGNQLTVTVTLDAWSQG